VGSCRSAGRAVLLGHGGLAHTQLRLLRFSNDFVQPPRGRIKVRPRSDRGQGLLQLREPISVWSEPLRADFIPEVAGIANELPLRRVSAVPLVT
jgi:hypothetical protein